MTQFNKSSFVSDHANSLAKCASHSRCFENYICPLSKRGQFLDGRDPCRWIGKLFDTDSFIRAKFATKREPIIGGAHHNSFARSTNFRHSSEEHSDWS